MKRHATAKDYANGGGDDDFARDGDSSPSRGGGAGRSSRHPNHPGAFASAAMSGQGQGQGQQGGGLRHRSANEGNGGGYGCNAGGGIGDHDHGGGRLKDDRLKDPEPDTASFRLDDYRWHGGGGRRKRGLGAAGTEVGTGLGPELGLGGLGGLNFQQLRRTGMEAAAARAARRKREVLLYDEGRELAGHELGGGGNIGGIGVVGAMDGLGRGGGGNGGAGEFPTSPHGEDGDGGDGGGGGEGGQGGGNRHHAVAGRAAGAGGAGAGAPAGRWSGEQPARVQEYMDEAVDKWKALSVASFDVLDALRAVSSDDHEERDFLQTVVTDAAGRGILDGTPFIASLADLLRGEDEVQEQQQPAEDLGGVGNGAAAAAAAPVEAGP